jgi:hypothetical protein
VAGWGVGRRHEPDLDRPRRAAADALGASMFVEMQIRFSGQRSSENSVSHAGDQFSVSVDPLSGHVAQKLVKYFTDMHDVTAPGTPYARKQ